MQVLAYGVTAEAVPVNISGVGEMPVERSGVDSLQLWFSTAESLPDDMKATAIEFHRVLSEISRQTVIVPFRFPTVMSSVEEAASFVDRRKEVFAADLVRLKDCMQMEIIVASNLADQRDSGTAYMQSKLAQSKTLSSDSERVLLAVSAIALETRTAEIKNGRRLFFLIRRDAIDAFMAAIAGCGVRGLRTTGPWPPTAFLSRELANAHV
jgi:hypothetical protein